MTNLKKRVLVTGGTGTLGSYLVPRLQAAGYTVRITSRRPRPADADPTLEWAQVEFPSGEGLLEAVDGADVVIHAASTPFKRGVDGEAMRQLLAAAQPAGVEHIVYISIVGLEDIDFFYYDEKLLCEELLARSGLGYSILRTTQWHDFLHQLLADMFLKLPIGFLPRGWQFQPIDEGTVADLLLDAVRRGPAGRLPDAGGPEVISFSEAAEIWMEARGRKPVVIIPFPWGPDKGFRTGKNLAPQARVGRLTWRDWVAANANLPEAIPA